MQAGDDARNNRDAEGSNDEDQRRRLGKLTVFGGIAQLPNRVKCAVLPWHTLTAALAGEARTSTEEGAPARGLAG